MPAEHSPYGPGGCAVDPGFSAVIDVTRDGGTFLLARISLGCAPVRAAPGCDEPPAPGKEAFAQTVPCLSWSDRWPDEQWFVVEITYYGGGLTYVFVLPAGSTAFRVPDHASPGLDESLERCLERKDMSLTVFGIRGDRSVFGVDGFARIAECGSP